MMMMMLVLVGADDDIQDEDGNVAVCDDEGDDVGDHEVKGGFC